MSDKRTKAGLVEAFMQEWAEIPVEQRRRVLPYPWPNRSNDEVRRMVAVTYPMSSLRIKYDQAVKARLES